MLEEGLGVSGRGCGEPDLHTVEVIKNFAPLALFLGRVASVTLIRDDQIKGMMSAV